MISSNFGKPSSKKTLQTQWQKIPSILPNRMAEESGARNSAHFSALSVWLDSKRHWKTAKTSVGFLLFVGNSEIAKKKQKNAIEVQSLKLTARTFKIDGWKINFLFGARPFFRTFPVSFRECTCMSQTSFYNPYFDSEILQGLKFASTSSPSGAIFSWFRRPLENVHLTLLTRKHKKNRWMKTPSLKKAFLTMMFRFKHLYKGDI